MRGRLCCHCCWCFPAGCLMRAWLLAATAARLCMLIAASHHFLTAAHMLTSLTTTLQHCLLRQLQGGAAVSCGTGSGCSCSFCRIIQLTHYRLASLDVCREKALLFLWDRQRLELHGVFRPDAAAKALPEASLPGGGADGRSQVREDGCS